MAGELGPGVVVVEVGAVAVPGVLAESGIMAMMQEFRSDAVNYRTRSADRTRRLSRKAATAINGHVTSATEAGSVEAGSK